MKLTAEARKARNEYFRNWRQKNPNKVRAAQARYWQRKAEKAQGKGDVQNG